MNNGLFDGYRFRTAVVSFQNFLNNDVAGRVILFVQKYLYLTQLNQSSRFPVDDNFALHVQEETMRLPVILNIPFTHRRLSDLRFAIRTR